MAYGPMAQGREDTIPDGNGFQGVVAPSGLKLCRTLRGHKSWIGRIAWSPKYWILATGSADNTVRLWDIEHKCLLRTLEGYAGSVQSVAWSPGNQRLASGFSGYTVRIWDARSGNVMQSLAGHVSSVCSVAWSPDGQLIASASDDQTIRIWDANTGETLRMLRGYHDIGNIIWSPNSRILAASSDQHTIRVWHSRSGTVLLTLGGHTHMIISLAWSPDGRVIVSGSDDSTVRVWDIAKGRQKRVLESHTDAVTGVSFYADGSLLASKSRDGTVRLWRCDNWQEVAKIEEPGSGFMTAGLAFHPHRRVLATLGERDMTIRIWKLNLEALLGEARTVPTVSYKLITETALPQEVANVVEVKPSNKPAAVVDLTPPSKPAAAREVTFPTKPAAAREATLPIVPADVVEVASPERTADAIVVEQPKLIEPPLAMADFRKPFKKAVLRVKALVADIAEKPCFPSCYISYAWGEPNHEQWVEQQLAADLQSAGINVLMDRRTQAVIDADAGFLDLIAACDTVMAVGTPLYRNKYETKLPSTGSIVSAELYLINMRLMSTKARKRSVWPVLLTGDEQTSLPEPMQGHLRADFRRPENYFAALFDLVLSLYGIPLESQNFADLRQALRQG